MKLVVQIPCLNEAGSIGDTIRRIPKTIVGISEIEILIVDDGSSDGTAEVAMAAGASRVLRLNRNRGLAAAFRTGLDAAIAMGADIVVNTDGDGQYPGEMIPAIIAPVMGGDGDIAIGDRSPSADLRNGRVKRVLYRIGEFAMGRICGLRVRDPVCGFRAISREAAVELNIFSFFSYTLEMIIQADLKGLKIVHVPIVANAPCRPSRLFGSVPQFIYFSCRTVLETYFLYRPLWLFSIAGLVISMVGTVPILRFLFLFVNDLGSGHVQSLVLGSGLVLIGVILLVAGLISHLVARNRLLLEQACRHVKYINACIRPVDLADMARLSCSMSADVSKPQDITSRGVGFSLCRASKTVATG